MLSALKEQDLTQLECISISCKSQACIIQQVVPQASYIRNVRTVCFVPWRISNREASSEFASSMFELSEKHCLEPVTTTENKNQ